MIPYTRVTTIANTLADRYALEQWAQRQIVLGIGGREDLYALAASLTADDKQELNEVAQQAQDYARARSGANLGTALHRLTERIDRDELLDPPAQWKPDIDSYCQTLADNRIQIQAQWIERVVVIPEVQAAGTLDRLVTINDDVLVADLKTGAKAAEHANETAIQLALYAHATHVYLGDEFKRDQYGRYLLPDPLEVPDAYQPMPKVNQDVALLIHLPAGEGNCTLHEVDIKAGWEAVQVAMSVRDWRKRKDLTWPLNPAPFKLEAVASGPVEMFRPEEVTYPKDDDW